MLKHRYKKISLGVHLNAKFWSIKCWWVYHYCKRKVGKIGCIKLFNLCLYATIKHRRRKTILMGIHVLEYRNNSSSPPTVLKYVRLSFLFSCPVRFCDVVAIVERYVQPTMSHGRDDDTGVRCSWRNRVGGGGDDSGSRQPRRADRQRMSTVCQPIAIGRGGRRPARPPATNYSIRG